MVWQCLNKSCALGSPPILISSSVGVLVPTHGFADTVQPNRPALHIQGAWAQGYAFHLAVADDDMKKDTNNNIDVFARLLECVFLEHNGLPVNWSLLQERAHSGSPLFLLLMKPNGMRLRLNKGNGLRGCA